MVLPFLKKVATALWGKFESKEEIKKFGLLAFIFGIIIGVYWTLRPLKDGIFGAVVGFKGYQPYAKMLSLVLIVPLLILYNKLIDKYPRQKVFYILCGTYGAIALAFYFLFSMPDIGLANTVASPTRIIGWLWYVYVESFGSLIVALFWAFTSDITMPEAAKRGFPLIFLFGQIGNICGPLYLTAATFGFATSAPIILILACLMFALVALLWVFMKITPKSQLTGFEDVAKESDEPVKEAGFLDGLKLLLSHKYLLGIAAILIFFEIIVTMFDYQFKVLVMNTFSVEKDVTAYLSQYAVWTGIVSTACVLFGINNIQRKLGMAVSLVLMPIIIAFAVIVLRISPVIGVAFWIMVVSKAINYALGQPSLKQAYIPTSKDSKYKAQSWIEAFGGRSSKAIGSWVNTFGGASYYLMMSSVISLGITGLWVFIAIFIAKTYNKAVKENKIIC